jgi:hypothetical protein
MGKRDSSKTRVKPVFEQLISQDKTGLSWLNRLLRLPHIPNRHRSTVVPEALPLLDSRWADREKSLDPPVSLLRWLINNLEIDPEQNMSDSEAVRRKRKALFHKDPDVIVEASSLLEKSNFADKEWYILEGKTKPDAYLETSNLIIVIEGKRTETTSTVETKWMSVRHQMIRHLDCTWEIKGSKQIFGFFILEGEGGGDAIDIPKHWINLLYETVNPEIITKSLPHRNIEEREKIANSFLGATTWQRVCAEFGIDWASLPDTC